MYRRLSWCQGTVRLRVILGESGMQVDRQALAWMFVIRILCWHACVGRVMHVLTESKAQFEVTFHLPRLAKLVVDLMDSGWLLTGWSVFNPRVTILRDPDFCVTNRPRQQLSLRLFGDADKREYAEPFRGSNPEEQEDEAEEEGGGAPTTSFTSNSSGRTAHSPRLVVSNGVVPFREPQGVDEVPVWIHGVADTATLYEGEDTDPLVLPRGVPLPVPDRPRPFRRQ